MLSITQNTLEKIRNELFRKVQTLPVKYFDSNPTGEIMSRFTNDIDNLDTMLNNSVTALFSGAVTIVGTLFFMITNIECNLNYKNGHASCIIANLSLR